MIFRNIVDEIGDKIIIIKNKKPSVPKNLGTSKVGTWLFIQYHKRFIIKRLQGARIL